MNNREIAAFLAKAKTGAHQFVLAIFPSQAALTQFRIDAANAFDASDMPMEVNRAKGTIATYNSTIKMLVAHSHLSDAVAGMVLTDVYGLKCLERFENSEDHTARILSRVGEPRK